MERLERDIQQTQRGLVALLDRQAEEADLDAEIHALFQEAMRKPVSARGRRQVRELYEALQEDGVLTPDPSTDPGPTECDCPFCRAEREADADQNSESGGTRARGGAQQDLPGFEDEEPFDGGHDSHGQDRARHASAAPDRAAALRQLYRDLALRFHPDRAPDEEQRARHETMMREVNRAYHGGDADRLLELSKELGIELDDLRGSDEILTELVRQYEAIKEAVRDLRYSPPGQLVVATRRAEKNGDPTPLEELEMELQALIDSAVLLRDFVGGYVAGTMQLRDFLRGPVESSFQDDINAMLDLLYAAEGEREAAPAARRSRKGRKKRRRR